MLTETSLNRITGIIIAAAIAVHKALGPGLLESAYITCLIFELRRRGLKVEEQRPVPVTYCGVKLDCGYRLDLVVEDQVIVEVKALERFAPIHTAQMLTYLRLTGCPRRSPSEFQCADSQGRIEAGPEHTSHCRGASRTTK
jgi:GxxExxY protein